MVNGFKFQVDSIKFLNRAIRHTHFVLARSPVHRLNWIPRSLYEMNELIARGALFTARYLMPLVVAIQKKFNERGRAAGASIGAL